MDDTIALYKILHTFYTIYTIYTIFIEFLEILQFFIQFLYSFYINIHVHTQKGGQNIFFNGVNI